MNDTTAKDPLRETRMLYEAFMAELKSLTAFTWKPAAITRPRMHNPNEWEVKSVGFLGNHPTKILELSGLIIYRDPVDDWWDVGRLIKIQQNFEQEGDEEARIYIEEWWVGTGQNVEEDDGQENIYWVEIDGLVQGSSLAVGTAETEGET